MREASPSSAASSAILRLLDRPVANADLEAASELAALPAYLRTTQTAGLLLFRLGEETAALPAAMLRRVTRSARPRPIPGLPAGVFRGVCNIRGELVLCADLHRLLGLPEQPGKPVAPGDSSNPQRMVVIGAAENSWAFQADSLVGIERFDPADLRPAPVTVAFSLGAFTSGVAIIDGRQVTVLDGERVLAGFKAGLP